MSPRTGDVVPPLERTISITDMVAYAGATWDWHKLHYDPAYAASKELPGPIVGFCRTGARSTSLWALSNAGQRSAEELIRTAADAGYDIAALRDRLAQR